MAYDIERGPEFSFEKKPLESRESDKAENLANLGRVTTYLTDANSPLNQALGAVSSQQVSRTLLESSAAQTRSVNSSTSIDHLGYAGGRSMSLQNTIREITALQRAVRDQIALINDFKKSNRDSIQLVQTELKGSAKGYDQMMLTALSQTEQSLQKSLTSLEQAASALDQVRAI